MKKVLIPIDLNIHCYEAIEYAVDFFKHEKCEFYFLNTYNYDLDELNAIHLLQVDDDWYDKPKNESEYCLGRVVQEFSSRNVESDHCFSAISECSVLIDGIKKTIKDLEIDIVVLPGKKNVDGDCYDKYSRNTKRILEHIRDCPVMIIPAAIKMHENPKFLLVSNFELVLPKGEIDNWYDLVQIANGSIKVVAFSGLAKLSDSQRINLNKLDLQLRLLSGHSTEFEFVEDDISVKDYVADHKDYIICLMDRKPGLLRRCGIKYSKITNLGPIPGTPIIALHR